ncbi:MAG: FtsX-like permease family protein, partial [Candidatus Acidiferrales bacterium]
SYSEEALLAGGWSGTEIHLDGAPPKQDITNLKQLPVGLNFFSTMRIPILAGRAFTSADFTAIAANSAARKVSDQAYDHAPPTPVIINGAFAKKFLPNKNPVGMHMGSGQGTDKDVQYPGPGYTIVGIAGNAKYDRLNIENEPILFLPVTGNSAHFELRTAANPTSIIKPVRGIVSGAGANLPLTEVRTQTEQIDYLLFQQRMLARLSGFFGVAALVLACIGLYGLLSYEVERRTRELGIRIALGAQRRDLLKLVVGREFCSRSSARRLEFPLRWASRASSARCSMEFTPTIPRHSRASQFCLRSSRSSPATFPRAAPCKSIPWLL